MDDIGLTAIAVFEERGSWREEKFSLLLNSSVLFLSCKEHMSVGRAKKLLLPRDFHEEIRLPKRTVSNVARLLAD
jgi:hypothetical protein